jgi:hypothetical protein
MHSLYAKNKKWNSGKLFWKTVKNTAKKNAMKQF